MTQFIDLWLEAAHQAYVLRAQLAYLEKDWLRAEADADYWYFQACNTHPTRPAPSDPTTPAPTKPEPVAGHQYGDTVSLLHSLVADGPAPELTTELALFGRFIGRWTVHNQMYSESTGQWSESELTWTFDWIIAGRGIQDVLVDTTGTALGTTVRTWDEHAGWRIVWFCPRAAEHVILTAADHGARIELNGVQADGRRVRWEFGDITADAFTWDGWCSNDQGNTWWHEQHMAVRRESQ